MQLTTPILKSNHLGHQAEIYRNQRGFFSINVRTIYDAELNMQNIVYRWLGSAHDSKIFNNSLIRGRFERSEMNDSVLVGDSGYALRNYMLTPLNQPT